jgi:hypothetical protein
VLALREGWLVAQLLGQVRELLDRLEAGQPLPAEVRTTLADLTTLASAAGAPPPPPVQARALAVYGWNRWSAGAGSG